MKKKEVKKPELGSFKVFDLYKEIINSNSYIDYQKLLASVLLECKLGFNSKEYLEFVKMYQEGFEKKFDLVLADFVITFNVNLKYSNDILVPMLADRESSNTQAINLKTNTNEKLDHFLKVFNKYVKELLKEQNYVEIFPKIILFVSKNTNLLKVIFDQDYVVYRG
ncbi:DUF2714 domain-containing protein [Mycoplasma capricolum subsp. capripneumoniae]|uniref:DUF2714 domain-containing protein n=1 Tax=Mycoplasma capricolum subsp. capripneumoniae 87001 TaxID=1124992 RepID=A0A9N7BEL1_MYCCC|nr:DUF2714 domain-containing protein [Mycoplasma capricolum]AJK51401.1 hypothetical protein MCCG_0433 [Mycoplasma capricolum subsp. capripneumoniae 87001]AOQ22080.1 hypothetical protein M1601_01940 [Mycoplasma capricolum subsp. capripneumoniae M1601]KEY84204.1 hypothetical protein MCCP_9170 [Mycoplasma capricolum subsp. capripneumoniae 99108]QDL19551.1 DUF2714 domain-containing protein [Mycoplasma capricolum subsp. capripneumoniae]QDL20236.1 DUF2714 domain-containing protein [Mycoplasma capric